MCELCYDKVREYIEIMLHGKIRVSQYDIWSGHKLGDDSIKLEDMEEGKC